MIVASSQKQKMERIRRWLSVLEQAGLIIKDSNEVIINETNLMQTLVDLRLDELKKKKFKGYLFNAYFTLRKERAGIVDIADLREEVTIKMLRNDKVIFTEKQFDDMLNRIPLVTNEYIISLGRPMGAEEKIFEYKGKYFRTFSLQLLKERSHPVG